MRPADLLAHQADFMHRYVDDDNPDTRMMKTLFAAAWMSGEKKANRMEGEASLSQMIRDGTYPPVVDDAPATFGHFASQALPIKVEANMVDLISWVSNDFDDATEIEIGLAPAPFGIVYLEKPLVIADSVEGDEYVVHIDWLIWGQSYGREQRAMAFAGFNDGSRPDAITSKWVRETFEAGYSSHPYHYTFISALADGQAVGARDNGPLFSRPTVWRTGENAGQMEFSTWPGPNMSRWLYALWVVMGQEIANVREEHVDRATKRRMTRMKLPPAVTVITLRRPANPHQHDEEGHVEWQHHWFVRGHPRWQPYGQGRKERKLIWIGPHVKGNLNAPLKQTEKVYRVAR